MGNVLTDWFTFRLGQKKKDLQMSSIQKARSKALGSVKKGQEGMKNKLKGGKKKDEDEEDDEDEEEEEKPAKEKEKKAKAGSAAMAKRDKDEEKPRGFKAAVGSANKTVAIRLDDIEEPLEVVGWVVALNGNHRGQDWRLHTGKNVLGTAADCDIVVTDPYLSAKHATIRHDANEGSFTLIDLDSTNGTYLNDKRITKDELIDNDTVRLGRTELKFKALF
ncbi:MAG: FHA domain-containing protein [Myxococcota bacterium]|jgi:hypothetical protein|nr:FHA domain-containing protein [Myxococcota bacterium]